NDLPVAADDSIEGATVNRTDTEQDGTGFGLQATWTSDLSGRQGLFVAGLSYDESDIAFSASTELGALDATRRAVPGGVLVGDAFTRMNADTTNVGLYLSGTFPLGDRMSLTVSGRYNRSDVELVDRLGTALHGSHEFNRFNPAVGLT